MDTRIRVVVHADPVGEAGIVGLLRDAHDLAVLSGASGSECRSQVAVVVADSVDDNTVSAVAAARRRDNAPVVAIVGSLDAAGALRAMEAKVTALLRREDTNTETLAAAIRRAVKGEGVLPPDLASSLLHRDDGPVQPRGSATVTQRELTVLRLVAEGYSTTEIAAALAYSERTVKSALHDLSTRYQLRNRSHAVAFALREGLI